MSDKDIKPTEDTEKEQLKEYPLRDPSEDPRWAVRTVKIWVGFALFCLGFILTLIILGVIFD